MAIGQCASGLLACLVLGSVYATADPGTWHNFTSMKNVTGIGRTASNYWAASSGGLFRWDRNEASYQQFTNAEGLQSIDLTALGIDRSGNVWTGSSTGVLHSLSPTSGTIITILDIARSDQINKAIHKLTMTGDSILICTDFGLTVFRTDRFEFRDTYTRFGTIPSTARTAVFDATLFEGRIWATVSDGQTVNRVASASLTEPNLLPPEAWTLDEVGPPGTVPRHLQVLGGRLYCGTTTGLFYRNGTSWTSLSQLASKNIVTLSSGSQALLACTASGDVFTVDQAGVVTQYGTALPFAAAAVTADKDGFPVVGSTGAGILTFSGTWEPHFPNGPNANQFISVTVSPAGVVWCGSGTTFGAGLYRYDGVGWQEITKSNSLLPTDDVYRVSLGCDGSIWASTFGRGLVELPGGETTLDSSHIFGTNVGMKGVPEDPLFVVPSNAVCDGAGNTWATIIRAVDRNVLAVRTRSGQWRTLPALINGVRVTTLSEPIVDKCLAVDAFDNLWSVVRDAAFRGIVSFGNTGGIDSTVAFHITAANGLPSDDVRTIIVDRDNDLWVGTGKGIAIVLDPSNPRRAGAIASYKPLNGLTINTIAVDPLNQKWVGTSEGVVLLSPDGTQVLATYTVESTAGKLIDSDVKSIAVDAKTGTVYFGTTSGLASLETAAAAPNPSFSELHIYPNPYVIPGSSLLTVDGLVENTSLRILTIDGTMVREIRTPGGRVGFWDGKDSEGNSVASGVYIIVAFSEDGSQVVNGKVAVVRR